MEAMEGCRHPNDASALQISYGVLARTFRIKRTGSVGTETVPWDAAPAVATCTACAHVLFSLTPRTPDPLLGHRLASVSLNPASAYGPGVCWWPPSAACFILGFQSFLLASGFLISHGQPTNTHDCHHCLLLCGCSKSQKNRMQRPSLKDDKLRPVHGGALASRESKGLIEESASMFAST